MSDNLTGQVSKAEAHNFDAGGFSDIWRGWTVNKDSKKRLLVAVKVLKGPVDDDMLNRLRREVRVWATLDHPNITPFFGISFDFDRPHTPCLISPYYRHGNIIGYLKGHRNADKLRLITQVAAALSHLHSHSIVHGDIKGRNVLINDNREACLVDFGLARILGESGFTTKSASSTFRFMSPELIPRGEQAEMSVPRVTEATDIWAFSMFVIEIMTQRMPFPHLNVDASVIVYVATGGRPRREHCQEIKDNIWHMLEQCWQADPLRRPSIGQLFHFFASQVVPNASAPFSSSIILESSRLDVS